MIYRSRNRYVWNTALGAVKLPRLLNPLWRRLAERPAVLREKGKR